MLPVYEPGALLFIGDGHARQGHGELTSWSSAASRPLLQAFQHATTELLRWLMSDYGFDERTASMLMGQDVEYEIANVVDPRVTVVAKLRKAHLPRR